MRLTDSTSQLYPVMLAILSVTLLCSLSMSTLGGSVSQGSTCSSTNDHLDPISHKFQSQCTDQTFCSGINGTCTSRLCRRDEFPFGYSSDVALPPLCSFGSFCPDDGSGCKPLVAVGQPCEMNRDEQCAPPADWKSLASFQNFNGSICLNTMCMYSNATLGHTCTVDATTYVDVGPDGQQFKNTVVRDNCRSPTLYCEPSSMVCESTKLKGLPCAADQECSSHNCGVNSICADPPEAPLKVAPWQYILTAFCVVGAMIAVSLALTTLHRRQRFERFKEVRDYHYEQISLRQSIIALHSAAVDRYSDEKM